MQKALTYQITINLTQSTGHQLAKMAHSRGLSEADLASNLIETRLAHTPETSAPPLSPAARHPLAAFTRIEAEHGTLADDFPAL